MSRLLKFGQPMGGVIQFAYIVPDVYKAAEDYAKSIGVGPFYIFEHFPLQDCTYRGKATDFDVTIAMAFSGSMCIEMIQQNNDVPSVYKDVYEERGWGFHHFAIATDTFDDHVRMYRDQGADQALYGVAGVGARAAYMDTRATLPGMIELIEMTDKTEDFFTGMYQASQGYTGKDPVRIFDPAKGF